MQSGTFIHLIFIATDTDFRINIQEHPVKAQPILLVENSMCTITELTKSTSTLSKVTRDCRRGKSTALIAMVETLNGNTEMDTAHRLEFNKSRNSVTHQSTPTLKLTCGNLTTNKLLLIGTLEPPRTSGTTIVVKQAGIPESD